MVGDSADDIEGAKQVGWPTYRYTGGGFGDLPDALDWSLLTSVCAPGESDVLALE